MTSTRSKSKLQSIALWTLIGTTLLSIILLQLKTVSSDSYLISGLIILLIIALFVHGIGMIYNAFLHKRVGWVIAMVVFGPLASIPYYFIRCDVNIPAKNPA